MKLKNVNIFGFKSFRDRVSVDISNGMTSIVGPNGCGKSNVVDAIKWAMGDMSAKSLRGEKMMDVIFAGSQEYAAMGMAEVTLTFENDGAWEDPEETFEVGVDLDEDGEPLEKEEPVSFGGSLPREFRSMAEIAITRRLHRSGESEYLINKTPCRLLDIQNLLAGTGVGKQGYSVIEQGRVGFIVSSKPKERRFLIEEASGITRYKAQRDRADRKLMRTEENLVRVDDILAEVTKQIRSLERQAKRAARYREIADELRALEVALLVARRDELNSEMERLVEQVEELESSIASQTTAMEATQEEIATKKREVFAYEQKHAEITEAFYRLDTTLNLAKSRAEHARVALQEAERRLGSSEQEYTAQKTRLEELNEELVQVTADLNNLDDSEEQASKLLEAEAALEELKRSLDDHETSRNGLQTRLETNRGETQRTTDRVLWIEQQLAGLSEREKQLSQEIDEASQEFVAKQGSIQKSTEERDGLQRRLAQSRERQAELEDTHEQTRLNFETAEGELSEVRSRRIELETRIGGLEAMREAGEGYDDAVQMVLAWAKEHGRSGVFGPLGDFVISEHHDETALANFLGERVSDIAVANHDLVFDIANALADELPGAVGFWVVPGASTAQEAVTNLLSNLEKRETFETGALNPTAVALPNGTVVFDDGRVRIGSDKGLGANVLRQRRLLRELEENASSIHDKEASLETAVNALREALAEASHRAQLARQETEALGLELHKFNTELETAERELQKLSDATHRLRSQLVPVFTEQEELSNEKEVLQRTSEELTTENFSLTEELRVSENAASSIRTTLEDQQGSLTRKKVALAELNERRRNLRAAKERLERTIESTATLIGKYSDESVQQTDRIEELRLTISNADSEVENSSEELTARQSEVDESKKTLNALQSRVSELELSYRDQRDEFDTLVAKRQKVEFTQRESAIGVEHVDEQLNERFELSHEETKAIVDSVETPREERKAKRDLLKKRIENLGPVNAMAEEEYEESKERFEFLTEQRQDLEEAIADLRKAIARMDRESRRRFKETFEAVNAKFKEIFPTLFKGGTAELLLTDPSDMLNTGVDIVVQPPGKRLQSVTLLSGGEKALTAVSLIFSIFILKPTPFSILDEVDAPLDEANVGRFARIVRELSETSQMIVITHSRRTMESSDMLYGVTMEQPGVSKLVSVRLSEIDDRLAS